MPGRTGSEQPARFAATQTPAAPQPFASPGFRIVFDALHNRSGRQARAVRAPEPWFGVR